MTFKLFTVCIVLHFCCSDSLPAPELLDHYSEREILLQLVRQNEAQQTQIDALTRSLLEQQKLNDILQTGRDVPNRRSRRAGGPRVEAAFTATTFNIVHNLTVHDTVIYTNISVNLGGHFTVSDGNFIAPVTGYYVISATIMSNIDAEIACEIVVNDESKATLYAKGDTNWHDQGSQTIVVRMNQGDRARVRSLVKNGDVYGLAFSSFSGFLLYQDQSDTLIIG